MKTSVDLIEEATEENQSKNSQPLPSKMANEASLMTIDEAEQQISADILSVLSEKFNGKLSGVRSVDQKDTLLNKENLPTDSHGAKAN